jgi:hypothetical protein
MPTGWVQFCKQAAKESLVVGAAAGTIIVGLTVYNHVHANKSSTRSNIGSAPLVAVGSRLTLSSADFGTNPISLVLFVSPTCKYCVASKPFHSVLASECQRNNVPLYVVVPSLEDATGYLRDLRNSASAVREWKDLNLRADGTPTIVAVDRQGVVRRLWVGQLLSTAESELLVAVRTRSIPESEALGFEGI